MRRNASVGLPTPPAPRLSPSERRGIKHPATRLCPCIYFSTHRKILGTPPPPIDDLSPRSANNHHLVVTRGLSRVAGRVSKPPSSADIGLRHNQRVRRRFSIERCLKLVREADSSTHNSRAQRLSIAKENTEMLLKAAMNHAYRYLGSNEPNLPDITLDGLEAIVNDLVHTVNIRDPSRGLRILGGRLEG